MTSGLLVYRTAFVFNDMGYATALTYVIAVVLLLFAAVPWPLFVV